MDTENVSVQREDFELGGAEVWFLGASSLGGEREHNFHKNWILTMTSLWNA